MDCLIKKEYWINRQVQIYKKTPDAEVIRPWIWRFLNKRTSNRYNLLINTDKKQAHAQTLYEKKLLTYPRTDSQSPRYGFA